MDVNSKIVEMQDLTIEELGESNGAGTLGTAGTLSTPASLGTASSW